MRKLTRGIELFKSFRIFWTAKNWRSKQHPYWFFAKYPGGDWTWQCMRLEVWRIHV